MNVTTFMRFSNFEGKYFGFYGIDIVQPIYRYYDIYNVLDEIEFSTNLGLYNIGF